MTGSLVKARGGCYEGTNITQERAVKNAKMQLNDALNESYRAVERTLDNLLEVDRGLAEIGCNGKSSISYLVGRLKIEHARRP